VKCKVPVGVPSGRWETSSLECNNHGVSNESLTFMECNNRVVACIDMVNALQSSGDLSHNIGHKCPPTNVKKQIFIFLGFEIMIKLTRFDQRKLVVNADLIEFVEATPDTIISLTTGKKILVQEGVDEIIDKVVEYRSRILPAIREVKGEKEEEEYLEVS